LRVLILGHSSIVRKRIRPALAAIPEIETVEIASRHDPEADHRDYEGALARSDAELVYVSVVNSEHACWVERALESDRHVVVDKPAFTTFEDAKRLVALARGRNLCLAEATVYSHHPQIQAIRDCFARAGSAPTRIEASFSFPPLPASDFRYRRALGGGALSDLGPYAVSPGRVFWGERPLDVECRILSTGGPDAIDTSFSMMLRYADGRSVVGHFGFTTAYRNRLSLLGPACGLDVDRIFTTPEDLENECAVTRPTGVERLKLPAGDAFADFMRDVVARIREADFEVCYEALLSDGFVLDRMRRSAQKGR
jgi:predicted dehydrogenase